MYISDEIYLHMTCLVLPQIGTLQPYFGWYITLKYCLANWLLRKYMQGKTQLPKSGSY